MRSPTLRRRARSPCSRRTTCADRSAPCRARARSGRARGAARGPGARSWECAAGARARARSPTGRETSSATRWIEAQPEPRRLVALAQLLDRLRAGEDLELGGQAADGLLEKLDAGLTEDLLISQGSRGNTHVIARARAVGQQERHAVDRGLAGAEHRKPRMARRDPRQVVGDDAGHAVRDRELA